MCALEKWRFNFEELIYISALSYISGLLVAYLCGVYILFRNERVITTLSIYFLIILIFYLIRKKKQVNTCRRHYSLFTAVMVLCFCCTRAVNDYLNYDTGIRLVLTPILCMLLDLIESMKRGEGLEK